MFVRRKDRERALARRMRRAGMSVRAIARELGVSQSSASVWTRGLSRAWPAELERVTLRRLPIWSDGRLQRCSRCEQELPTVSFSRHGNRRQWWCRVCFASYRAARRDRARALARARRDRGRRTILEHLRATPCVDCGEDDVLLLEFDHLADKHDHVSVMAYRGASAQRLVAEIAKCEVVCCACHRRRTAARRLPAPARAVSAAVSRNFARIEEVLASASCLDCGEAERLLLDFDHVGVKHAPVARLARSGASLASLDREIASCEVRCVRCHRRRTARQFGWWRLAQIDASNPPSTASA